MAKFQKGISGNPLGKPKGAVSKKTKVLTMLFDVFESHQKNFKSELNKEAEKNILNFFKSYIAPFLPRDINLMGELELTQDNMTYEDALKAINEFNRLSKKRPAKGDKNN